MGVREEIEQLEQALVEALSAHDRPALERILAPEFRLVGIRSTGQADMPRQPWLEASKDMVFHQFEVGVKAVEDYGDVAISTVDGYWRMDWRALKIDERFLLTDVWLHRDRAWRLVRRHSSPYQPPDAS